MPYLRPDRANGEARQALGNRASKSPARGEEDVSMKVADLTRPEMRAVAVGLSERLQAAPHMHVGKPVIGVYRKRL